jgi:iron complex outermembrane receptor protein
MIGEADSQDEKFDNKFYIVPHTDSLTFEMQEVVVTGTRTHKKIIDIPYSVNRLSSVNYKYDTKIAVSDVLACVPGLFMQSRYGNHDVRISIRGFGSRSNSGIRGVRILLDGIPESEPDGQTRIEAIDFNSVGSIEIVKGNSSSLYTNAPGGVVNFINNVYIPQSTFTSFNEFGSFGLRRNGFKTSFRGDNYGFLLTYTYHNYKGYRKHSEDYWHIVNSVLETSPTINSRLEILGYFVSGLIRLPGSLTQAEFDTDPLRAAKREVDFDFRRISKKGRLGLRFNSYFGEKLQNQVELIGYGTIKYFERTSREYRIINRIGIGSSFKFVNKSEIFNLINEFSFGGDLLYQSGPVDYYNNINGKKGDDLSKSIDESIINTGFYISNSTELYQDKLLLLLTGRYDQVTFDHKNLTHQVQNDIRRYGAFTPKAAFNYKITPFIALYTSFGYSFDSPAGNELHNYPLSSSPGKLLNPDLRPQKSANFELGMKGSIQNQFRSYLKNIVFEITFFNSIIRDEIVPFEVFGEVYFRNSAKTNRTGIEVGNDVDIYKGLKMKIVYTYSKFRYDEYSARVIAIDRSGNLVVSEKSFSGNEVPSVPAHNLIFGVSYEKKFYKENNAFAKVAYQYVSAMSVDDANSQNTNSYSLLNSVIGFDLMLESFNVIVAFGINNIFNSKYVGFININSANYRFYETGRPRNYFTSINIKYSF